MPCPDGTADSCDPRNHFPYTLSAPIAGKDLCGRSFAQNGRECKWFGRGDIVLDRPSTNDYTLRVAIAAADRTNHVQTKRQSGAEVAADES